MSLSKTGKLALIAVFVSSALLQMAPADAQTKKPPKAKKTPVVVDSTFRPGGNLMTNPSHEEPGVFFQGRGELFVSWDWVPFWAEPPAGYDQRDQRWRTPEFRMADGYLKEFKDRVHSGRLSNHGFNYFAANPTAGFMQYVKNLRPGSPVRFTSWVQLWSSNVPNLVPPKSVQPGNLEARLCIDQDGGPRDHTDPNLICSEWSKKYDDWHQLSVDGVAKGPVVNAYLWTRSSDFVEHNDYYMDDSCFEVLNSPADKGICTGASFLPTAPGVIEYYKANGR
jgi:hypothetical protein